MAYSNFIPTIWNEAIQRNLERTRVFVEDCNRQYEGDVKKKGDQVRILGVGKPTVRSLTRSGGSGSIVGPEEIEDTSVTLIIDQAKYVNFEVDDLDKAQAVGGVMDALMAETAEALANEEDKYIADMVTDENVDKLTTSPTQISAQNVLATFDAAIQKLYENDVKPTTEIVATVSPRFFTIFKQAYITKDTDNSEMMKNGRVARYGNVTIKMSNNVKKTQTSTAGDTDNIMIRTKRAIAFVEQLNETEGYRPDNAFADAVKSLILYGGKVVRPKEIINMNVTYAS